MNSFVLRSVLLFSMLAPSTVCAQPAASSVGSPANQALLADAGALPTSRALVAAMSILPTARFDESALRGAATWASRSTFAVAGSNVSLMGGGSDVPRAAIGLPGGGVAFLARLPSVNAGVASTDPTREPAYVLATVDGTRIRIWGFFSQLPSDGALSRRMIAAFARLGAPIATFDRTFQPSDAVGVERYSLKP